MTNATPLPRRRPSRCIAIVGARCARTATWSAWRSSPCFAIRRSGDVFPSVVRTMRRGFNASLKHAFFTFTHRRAKVRPAHYTTLGLKSIGRGVFAIDRQLAEIDRSFDLLLQATPVNAETAWREFRRSRFESRRCFTTGRWRSIPCCLKRQLYLIPVERIEDPTLSYLFRQKQEELDRQITLLSDVDSPRFLHESLQIYGGVSDWLLEHAKELLDRVPTRSGEDSVRGQLDADRVRQTCAAGAGLLPAAVRRLSRPPSRSATTCTPG